jgi:hypothetical protein
MDRVEAAGPWHQQVAEEHSPSGRSTASRIPGPATSSRAPSNARCSRGRVTLLAALLSAGASVACGAGREATEPEVAIACPLADTGVGQLSAMRTCLSQGRAEPWCDCYARHQVDCRPGDEAAQRCDQLHARGPRIEMAATVAVRAEQEPPPANDNTSVASEAVSLVDLVGLATADERPVRYRRKEWRLWTDDDRDCQDARSEVLIAESEVAVTFKDSRRCKVASGRWTCRYTGEVVTDPRRLDIDHLVPLGNAARSGGQSWDAATKRRYANDLEHPEQLIAVVASANRAKGDRGPEKWMPPDPAYRCTYLRDWFTVKTRWKLGVSSGERAALTSGLAVCGSAPTAAMAAAPDANIGPPSTTGGVASPAAGTTRNVGRERNKACSRVCKSSCPCGNSCISCSRRCTKPPGTACSSGGR